MSTTKPAAPSTVAVQPATLTQHDLERLPIVHRRGIEARRDLALGAIRGRVAVEVTVRGPVSFSEARALAGELLAMAAAGEAEQYRQDREADRALEVETLARAHGEADLAAALDEGTGPMFDGHDEDLIRDAYDLLVAYRRAGVKFGALA